MLFQFPPNREINELKKPKSAKTITNILDQLWPFFNPLAMKKDKTAIKIKNITTKTKTIDLLGKEKQVTNLVSNYTVKVSSNLIKN